MLTNEVRSSFGTQRTPFSPGAPVQAALRAKLDAVLAEQDDRARMAAGA